MKVLFILAAISASNFAYSSDVECWCEDGGSVSNYREYSNVTKSQAFAKQRAACAESISATAGNLDADEVQELASNHAMCKTIKAY